MIDLRHTVEVEVHRKQSAPAAVRNTEVCTQIGKDEGEDSITYAHRLVDRRKKRKENMKELQPSTQKATRNWKGERRCAGGTWATEKKVKASPEKEYSKSCSLRMSLFLFCFFANRL